MSLKLPALLLAFSLVSCTSLPHETFLVVPGNANVEAQLNNNRGITEFESGSPTKAQRYFEQAVEADQALPQPHYNLGLALYRLGKRMEAEKHFSKAASLAPSDPIISNYRKVYVQEDMPESP